MADTNARTIVGGFVTKTKTCPATGLRHMLSMTTVLGYGEQHRGVCENCRMPVTVQGAAWVSDAFTIVEEPDLLDQLRC